MAEMFSILKYRQYANHRNTKLIPKKYYTRTYYTRRTLAYVARSAFVLLYSPVV